MLATLAPVLNGNGDRFAVVSGGDLFSTNPTNAAINISAPYIKRIKEYHSLAEVRVTTWGREFVEEQLGNSTHIVAILVSDPTGSETSSVDCKERL